MAAAARYIALDTNPQTSHPMTANATTMAIASWLLGTFICSHGVKASTNATKNTAFPLP